jgi:hypothetical protein
LRVCQRCYGEKCKNIAIETCKECGKEIGIQCRKSSFSHKITKVICDTCYLKGKVNQAIADAIKSREVFDNGEY